MMIRNLEEKDIEAVLKISEEVREYHRALLDGEYLPLDVMKERKAMERGLADAEAHFLVAEDDNGRVVGYLFGRKTYVSYLARPDVAVVDELGVQADCRRQGVGRKLLDAFFHWCRKEKVDEVRLGVYVKNENAGRFYERYGFYDLERGMRKKV